MLLWVKHNYQILKNVASLYYTENLKQLDQRLEVVGGGQLQEIFPYPIDLPQVTFKLYHMKLILVHIAMCVNTCSSPATGFTLDFILACCVVLFFAFYFFLFFCLRSASCTQWCLFLLIVHSRLSPRWFSPGTPASSTTKTGFSLNVFYLSQNNKLDRTQVQRTYEVFSYIQFYNNTKHAKWT